MQNVTEQQILAMAPNAAAASNGKKISAKGGFVRLECSADDTFYLGECTGSGKSNYITTVDFIDPGAPVCRCSCPSRQFPCKHGLALLYEIAAGKTFGTCEIPEDILKKRAKKSRSSETGEKEGAEGEEKAPLTEEEAAKKKAAAEKSAKSAKAARMKKLKKQLEGLEFAEKLVRDLVKAGLGTMGGTTLKTYEQLSKQLGDYYLPGPQRLLNRLMIEIAAFQKDGDEEHYDSAISVLEKIWTLVKKSKQYLADKMEVGNSMEVGNFMEEGHSMEVGNSEKGKEGLDDNELYEELGGIWKLTELEALGKTLSNADLMQLSFWCIYDEARKEYIDTGAWADLSNGTIYMTYNYRPIKALKYVKQEDSIFGVAHVDSAACYPGQGNLHVRWNGAQFRDTTGEDIAALRRMAVTSLATETKSVKNTLKNAIAAPVFIRLIAFSEIGKIGDSYVLKNAAGETIALGDAPGIEPSVERILLLPEKSLLKDQVLLGAFYYDGTQRRLKLQPLSIVTENNVVRLLY